MENKHKIDYAAIEKPTLARLYGLWLESLAHKHELSEPFVEVFWTKTDILIASVSFENALWLTVTRFIEEIDIHPAGILVTRMAGRACIRWTTGEINALEKVSSL